jgi:hypothetical protein
MRYSVTVTLLLVLMAAACASKPETELQAAEEAVKSAKSAGADVYASQSYQEALDALEKARKEIAAQESKWAFARDYSEALQMLNTVVTEAQEASAEAADRKVEVKGQAEPVREEAQEAIGQARKALESAPTGKGSRADLQALKRDLQKADSTYGRAVDALDAGDYLSALNGFQDAKAQAQKVVSYLP